MFEISNSTKSYPSVGHASTNEMMPAKVFLCKGISMRCPSVFRQPPMLTSPPHSLKSVTNVQRV